jgi:hypothetical protein
MAIAQQLVKQDPQNATAQRDLSLSHDRVGDMLARQGSVAGALESYRASLDVPERVAKQDPQNAEAQRALSVSHLEDWAEGALAARVTFAMFFDNRHPAADPPGSPRPVDHCFLSPELNAFPAPSPRRHYA